MISQLNAKRASLLDELNSLTQILNGSWVKRYSVCSREGCKCRSGDRHGPRYYVVVNVDEHQRQKYVPQAQVRAALKGIEQYHRLQEIVEEITRINLALIKQQGYLRSWIEMSRNIFQNREIISQLCIRDFLRGFKQSLWGIGWLFHPSWGSYLGC